MNATQYTIYIYIEYRDTIYTDILYKLFGPFFNNLRNFLVHTAFSGVIRTCFHGTRYAFMS